MIKDSSWILAFIEDLRDVARERDLADLATDLETVLERHRPRLAAASLPLATPETPGNVVSLKDLRRA